MEVNGGRSQLLNSSGAAAAASSSLLTSCASKLWQTTFRSCPLPLSVVVNNTNLTSGSINGTSYLESSPNKNVIHHYQNNVVDHLASTSQHSFRSTRLSNGSVISSPKRRLSSSEIDNHNRDLCESNEGDDPDEQDSESVDAFSCYLCTYCGKGCPTERDLLTHIGSAHQDDDDSQQSSPVGVGGHVGDDGYCSPNEEKTPNGTPICGPYQYACKYCPRTFSSNSTLNVHYTHTHRDKPQYECEICGQSFSVKRDLATHRRLHDGQPTHRCTQCGKEFGTKQLLRKHELWHTGERTHVCPQCNKAFFQKGHLTQHLMIHAGGRPHACHLCPKTFIFKFDLNRHMKIHAERVITGNESSSTGEGCVGESSQQLTNGVHPLMTSSSAAASPSRTAEDAAASSFSQQLSQQQSSALASQHYERSAASLVEITPFIAMQLWRKNSYDQQSSSTATTSISPLTPIFRRRSATSSRESRRMHVQTPIGATVSPTLVVGGAQLLGAGAVTAAKEEESTDKCDDADCGAAIGNGYAVNGRSSPDQSSHCVKMAGETVSTDNDRSPTNSVSSSFGGDGGVGGVSTNVVVGSAPEMTSSSAVEMTTVASTSSSSCDKCVVYRVQLEQSQRCVTELEHLLMQRHREIEALQSKVQQIGHVASYLVETCSDFDKMWLLHNKKMYNQMQHVLNTFQ